MRDQASAIGATITKLAARAHYIEHLSFVADYIEKLMDEDGHHVRDVEITDVACLPVEIRLGIAALLRKFVAREIEDLSKVVAR